MSTRGPLPIGWDEIFDRERADAGLDSTVPFLGLAQALACHAEVVLEVGCGRGAMVKLDTTRPFADLRGPGRKVIGIDIDPVGAENPVVDEFRLIESPTAPWPVETGSVDLAVSDFVLEHVADPQAFVAELTRVLRPGGALVARTVSRRSPLSIGARLVPNRRHAGVVGTLQPGRAALDVFPTCYLMNDRKALAALLDPAYDWALVHRTGLNKYLGRWRALARVSIALETRLPGSLQMILLVYARKRA